VLPDPDLTVQVAVSGFDLRPPLQETREPNAGHIEYFLDVPPTFDQPTPLGEDNIIHSGRFSETFAGVAPGEHTVFVCLAYDDHTCVDPSLTDSAVTSASHRYSRTHVTLEVHPTRRRRHHRRPRHRCPRRRPRKNPADGMTEETSHRHRHPQPHPNPRRAAIRAPLRP
jgi:hypothetical protein